MKGNVKSGGVLRGDVRRQPAIRGTLTKKYEVKT
jgi:hypothetical protein